MRDDKTSIEMDRLQNTVTGLKVELGKYRRELEQARETLRDRYTMAALTGLLSYSCNDGPNGNYHSNCSVEGCIADARKYADAAMKARKA